MKYEVIDEARLADSHAHFGGRQVRRSVFNIEDRLIAGGFHSRRRLSTADQVAELGRRPRRELSIPHAVDQTSAVKDVGKTTIVPVIHKVEVAVDRGRDG